MNLRLDIVVKRINHALVGRFKQIRLKINFHNTQLYFSRLRNCFDLGYGFPLRHQRDLFTTLNCLDKFVLLFCQIPLHGKSLADFSRTA
jgi:hypothetical protein